MNKSTQYRREIRICDECAGMRLDQAISCLWPDITRSQAQKLIEESCVVYNGTHAKKRERVQAGGCLCVEIPEVPSTSLEPEKMEFSVLYEDDVLFVIDKPAGLVVHPAHGHWEGTFAHGFLAHCMAVKNLHPVRPGVVHRLDKDTTGVLIAAKTSQAVEALSKQFHDRKVQKWYTAILIGKMAHEIRVDAPIGRSPHDRKKMACVPDGKRAVSIFRPLSCHNGLSLAEVEIETGRTHQIRVHAKHIGFPVLGDPVYGRVDKGVHRQMLHCSKVVCRHPVTDEELTFFAPLPHDMMKVYDE